MTTTPPPPPLMEDLVEEILLRLPPHEPASLARAALICKPWCRLVSSPRFRRRFREHHRTPPMLGLLCNHYGEGGSFVPTTAASSPLRASRLQWLALDARHGRVLLVEPRKNALLVWDPLTDDQLELPRLPRRALTFTAAVVCANAVAGDGDGHCHHLGCHRGPFLVVFVGCDPGYMFVCTYSSDASTVGTRAVCLGSALYLGIPSSNKVLMRYDLELREISWIQLPVLRYCYQRSVLAAMEDGVLGLITIGDSYGKHDLCVWRRKEDSPNANAGWTQSKVTGLRRLLRVDPLLMPDSYVAGFADGLGIVFLKVDDALYTIDLKNYMVNKVFKDSVYAVFPYMSFCFPALEAACFGEEPSAGGSSA